MLEKENIIRIEDYSKVKQAHNKILEILNNSGISCYNALGILETIKQEIFLENEEEEGANSPTSS